MTDAGPAGRRPLPFLVVKRTNPRLRQLYGHWWIEMDRVESYGWWPDRPLRVWHWFTGAGGVLNGIGLHRRATPGRDALHRVPADHRFTPVLVVDKTDDAVRREIRAFAATYTGDWRWSWPWTRRPTQNCRTFQQALFTAVGIEESDELLYTHGPGCPVMFPVRRAGWRLRDTLVSWFAGSAPSTRSRHRWRPGRRDPTPPRPGPGSLR